MEADEYTRLGEQEHVLWWFGLLHRNLFASLDALGLPQAELLCADLGCGTGGFIATLRRRIPGWSVVGLDKSQTALRLARQDGAGLICGNVQRLPLKADTFDVVFAIDVMYHRDVAPAEMLAGIFAILKPGGIVVLNNPAYEWLRSYHDAFVHTARRYTAGGVAADLRRAGFTVERCTYWNTILFPFMVLKRKLLPGNAIRSDVHDVPAWLNRLFAMVSLPEATLLRYGVNLPFGGSVLAIGRKRR